MATLGSPHSHVLVSFHFVALFILVLYNSVQAIAISNDWRFVLFLVLRESGIDFVVWGELIVLDRWVCDCRSLILLRSCGSLETSLCFANTGDAVIWARLYICMFTRRIIRRGGSCLSLRVGRLNKKSLPIEMPSRALHNGKSVWQQT